MDVLKKFYSVRENVLFLVSKIKEDARVIQGEIKDLEESKLRLASKKESIQEIEGKIREKEKQLAEQVEKRKILELESSELEIKIKEREKLETELEKTKVLLASKREALSLVEKEESKVLKEIASLDVNFKEDELQSLKESLSKRKLLIEQTNNKYISILSQLDALELNKKDALTKKERIFKLDICPSCLQDVPEAHKHNIINESEHILSEIKKKSDSLEEEKKIIFSSLEKEKISLPLIEQQIVEKEIIKSKISFAESAKNKRLELQKSGENLAKDIQMLSQHMDHLKEIILSFSKFYNLFRRKQEDLEQKYNEEKQLEISQAEMKKELEITKKEVALLFSQIESKEQARKKLEELLNLNDWLANQFLNIVQFTERSMLLQLRIEFSKLFSKWFHMLAGESFEVHLDENFTPVVMHREVEMEYSFLSGGERTAVALAYRLALNQTINSVFSTIATQDIVILDEPTEGFSDFQLDKIRDVLEELNVAQLIIVSHEPKIESFVDNIIRLKKDADTSYVENTSPISHLL